MQSFSEEQQRQVLMAAVRLKGDEWLGHSSAGIIGLVAFAEAGTLLFEMHGLCSQYIAGTRHVGHAVVCVLSSGSMSALPPIVKEAKSSYCGEDLSELALCGVTRVR